MAGFRMHDWKAFVLLLLAWGTGLGAGQQFVPDAMQLPQPGGAGVQQVGPSGGPFFLTRDDMTLSNAQMTISGVPEADGSAPLWDVQEAVHRLKLDQGTRSSTHT
jgi:hypothetical protein